MKPESESPVRARVGVASENREIYLAPVQLTTLQRLHLPANHAYNWVANAFISLYSIYWPDRT